MKKILLFSLFINLTYSQTDYPKDYFGDPLNIPPQLSGNFAELRTNHFHTGLDYRTQKRTGLPVFASADGYVARIKISSFGNGKTLYINHPNGYMTVYAHLQKTNGHIEAYIKEKHYALKSYEMDLDIKPNQLLVKKEDTIGFSGNSGSSEGPHLHFEIRDSKTQKIINPFLFGFGEKFPDNRKPIISKLIVYPIDSSTVVNKSGIAIPLNLSKTEDGIFRADKTETNGRIGFGIETADYDNVSGFKNGIYSIKTYYNGELYYDYLTDINSFDEGHFVNAILDFPLYKSSGKRVQKLYMNRAFHLGLIKKSVNNGVIEVHQNFSGTYRIEVADFQGNKTVVDVPISYGDFPPIIKATYHKPKYTIIYGKESILKKDSVSISFPINSFYDDVLIDFDVKGNVLELQNNLVPVQKYFRVSFTTDNLPKEQKLKMYIATVTKNGFRHNTTHLKGNTYSAKVKSMEKFALITDTICPRISSKKDIKGKTLDGDHFLEFIISDSLSGIKSYNAYINDKWILMEYDYKTKTITHDFNDNIATNGRNDLKVVVEDKVGNTTVFETYFFRSH